MAEKTLLPVAGLQTTIWARPGRTTGPVAIVFILHGRTGSMDDSYVDDIAKAAVDKSGNVGVIAVAFDQRNHGTRLIDKRANDIWANKDEEGNKQHAVDMIATLTGTARDVSFLIDFLPAYLYPSGERTVVQWGVVGVSLGGHAAWICLAEEPRVSLGVPIIGCPDIRKLFVYRSDQVLGKQLEAPSWPPALADYVLKHDVANKPHSAFAGKRVRVLSGKIDKLVPWSTSETFVDGLDVGPFGVKQVTVYEGVGHAVTPDMVKDTVAFIGEWVEAAAAKL